MTGRVFKALAVVAISHLIMLSAVRSEDVQSASDVQRRASLSQFGITCTFDQQYPCGQFANGDCWVVGPVVVTEISPGLADGRNGSMANPIPAHEQGYDSRAWNYNPGLSVQTPFEMDVNVSLVSTISNPDTGDRKLIELKTAAVLTCLAKASPAGTFRPPFCGTEKLLHNVSQLKRELLRCLAPVAGTPTLSEAERWFERPWLSHLNHYKSQDIHPADNMPGYGREVAKQTGDAALLLALDIPEWGILHAGKPSADNMHLTGIPYRAINLSGMAGIVLAARIFDQTDTWNHPPLFDYFDRAWDLTGRTFRLDRNGATPFAVSMWNTYRKDYGRVWKRNDTTPVSLDDDAALGNPASAFYSVGSTQ